MENFNWKPFATVATLFTLLFVIGLGVMTFSRPVIGDWPGVWWGMGGMGFFWILPLFGLVMMLTMMFVFVNMMISRGGPTGWIFVNWPRNFTCPSCGSPVQQDWKVCPHCGASLKQ
mgnify:CR=1 FL=1